MNTPMLLGLTLSLAVVGCSAVEPKADPHPTQADGKRHWALEIDAAFSTAEADTIIQAAQSWEQVVPVQFDISMGCSGVGTCIQPASQDAVNTFCSTVGKTMCTAGDDSQVLIAYGWVSWTGSVAHELGHVQGLSHSTDDKDLMYPITGGRSGPQSGDVVAWNRLWQ